MEKKNVLKYFCLELDDWSFHNRRVESSRGPLHECTNNATRVKIEPAPGITSCT